MSVVRGESKQTEEHHVLSGSLIARFNLRVDLEVLLRSGTDLFGLSRAAVCPSHHLMGIKSVFYLKMKCFYRSDFYVYCPQVLSHSRDYCIYLAHSKLKLLPMKFKSQAYDLFPATNVSESMDFSGYCPFHGCLFCLFTKTGLSCIFACWIHPGESPESPV